MTIKPTGTSPRNKLAGAFAFAALLMLPVQEVLAIKAHTVFDTSIGCRFKPIAIYNNGTEQAQLEFSTTTTGGTLAGTFYNLGNSLSVGGNNSAAIAVTLYDDGTNGDAAAADGIYTLNSIVSNAAPDTFDNKIMWTNYAINIQGTQFRANLGVVQDGIAYSSVTLGLDINGYPVVATEYVVSIQDDAYVDGSEGGSADDNFGAVAKKLYGALGDTYDFMISWSVLKFDGGSNSYTGLRNGVQGLGSSGNGTVFDTTDALGVPPDAKDEGVATGFIQLNGGGASSVLAFIHHELAHRWAVYLGSGLGFAFANHWGGSVPGEPGNSFSGDTPTGLYGAIATGNQGSTVTVVLAAPVTYSPTELYLMGLEPAASVPDSTFYKYQDSDKAILQTFTLDVDDIIAAFGARNPSVSSARKNFNSAFIVVSPPGEELTPAELALYSIAAQHYVSTSAGSGYLSGAEALTPASFQWATGYRATMSGKVLAFNPDTRGAFAGSANTASSITWTWAAVAGATGYKVFTATDSTELADISTNTWNELNLATNTAYGRQVRAYNSAGTSDLSQSATTYTLAAPPAAFALDEVFLTSITVTWTHNTNPPSTTTYRVDSWETGGSTTSAVVDGTSTALTGLSSNTTYYLAIYAMNAESALTDSGIILSTRTQQVTSQTGAIDPTISNTINFNAPSGLVQVNIPAGSFTGATQITIQVPALLPAAPSPSINLSGTGVGTEVLPDNTLNSGKEVTITVTYQNSEVLGMNEDRLILARYDPGLNIWIMLPSTPDPANNKVTGRTDHLSLFQIMQVNPAGTVSGIIAYPNPFMPSSGHTQITFSNLPAAAKLRIYTLSGEFVKSLVSDALGFARWDGNNSSGRKTASGIYFVVAKAAGGKKTVKIAILR